MKCRGLCHQGSRLCVTPEDCELDSQEDNPLHKIDRAFLWGAMAMLAVALVAMVFILANAQWP